MTGALVALGLVMAAVLLTLGPLLQPEAAPAIAEPGADLAASREDALRALRELDLDHAMGKITDDDHARLRSDLERRAVRILAAIDAGPGTPERGE